MYHFDRKKSLARHGYKMLIVDGSGYGKLNQAVGFLLSDLFCF
ncbi:uncharacterized protein EbC_37120 [Erwinia billingiae Eb661]|uniref:Uncharacterized protein n=1 Tax=Erwinia billingiae (strain Eb661) TaxID=634500 RepID=D8MWN6_ERWBE|nr:uncharacterized protein EbC_37120 [Erwinia billingiae Eb661]